MLFYILDDYMYVRKTSDVGYLPISKSLLNLKSFYCVKQRKLFTSSKWVSLGTQSES